MNDQDEDAALVDSFFLPGGILDPSSFYDSDEEEEEEEIRQPRAVLGHHQRESGENENTDNPWRTQADKDKDALGILWEEGPKDAENIETIGLDVGESSLWPFRTQSLLPQQRHDENRDEVMNSAVPDTAPTLPQHFLEQTRAPPLSPLGMTNGQEGRPLISSDPGAGSSLFASHPQSLSALHHGINGEPIPLLERPDALTSENLVGIGPSSLLYGSEEVDRLQNTQDDTPVLASSAAGSAAAAAATSLLELTPRPPPPPGFEQTEIIEKSSERFDEESVEKEAANGHMDGDEQMAEQEITDSDHCDFRPLEMLHTRGRDENSQVGSSTSSLSESFCGSNHRSDVRDSEKDEEDEEDGEPESTLTEERKQKSETGVLVDDMEEKENVRVFHKPPSSEAKDTDIDTGKSTSVTTSCREEGKPKKLQSQEEKTAKGSSNPAMTAFQSMVSVLYESSPSQRTSATRGPWHSPLFQIRTALLTRIQKIAGRLVETTSSFCRFFFEIWGRLAPFVVKFSRAFCAITNWVARFLIFLVYFSVLVCKSAILELLEDPRSVAICYVAMYQTPTFVSLIMQFLNLPHWMPHLISCLVLYGVCRPGPRNHVDLVKEKEKAEEAQKKTGKGRQDGAKTKKDAYRHGLRGSEQKKRLDMHMSNDVACTVLQIIRGLLPLLFFLDGFSRELGSVMSLEAPARVIVAYVISLFRSGLPLSPIGWMSWSIQVLAVRYGPRHVLLEYFVLAIGLSSLRFIRVLEEEDLKQLQPHD